MKQQQSFASKKNRSPHHHFHPSATETDSTELSSYDSVLPPKYIKEEMEQEGEENFYWTDERGDRFPSSGANFCNFLLLRLPLSSLAAFALCAAGVLLFFLMVFWAFNASVEQFRRVSGIAEIPRLDQVNLAFLVSGTLMAVVAVALLSLGVLNTGATRRAVYARESARRGGRVAALLAISLASVLLFAWLGIFAVNTVFGVVYATFVALCASAENLVGEKCLDFSLFRPLIQNVGSGRFSQNNANNLVLCRGELEQFCAISNSVALWYLCGLVGCILLCFGLVLFIASGAANYAHIGAEARYEELWKVVEAELASAAAVSVKKGDQEERQRRGGKMGGRSGGRKMVKRNNQ